MVTPSMPGAPLLAFTRFHARARLSLSSTSSSSSMGFAVLCQLASALWAFYAVPVRRLALLLSGFLQTTSREVALAVG
ncbi:hypothetical protein Cenrod_0067 [Candidatus Symbiobacter mobilis CR]|uniref:Uncharacterized protein n=1 Tax=Candidatus Symbiobacter mobilis CR TaxID=946483 RepID=U5N4E4_9BURK|nr:hypothetical protein Cenrod_0067 [Candidatus Symbiobacter mobilis CR]